jgi:hypothetical protein
MALHVFPFVWQAKENKQKVNATKAYAFLHAFTLLHCI